MPKVHTYVSSFEEYLKLTMQVASKLYRS